MALINKFNGMPDFVEGDNHIYNNGEAEAMGNLLDALRAHVSALEDENRGLKSELSSIQETGKSMMEKLYQKDQEIAMLNGTVMGSRQDMENNDNDSDQKIRKLLEEKASVIKTSEIEISAAVAEKQRAQHHLLLETEKTAKLMTTLQLTATKLEEADGTVEQLEGILNEGKAGIYREVEAEVVARYEPQIEDYKKKQTMLLEGLDQLENGMKETEERLEREKKALEERVSELEDELLRATADLKKENERLISELRTATAAGDDLQARLAVTETQAATAAHEAEYAIATLETDLAELQAHNNLVETELRTLRAEKVGLRARVDELEGYLATLGGDGYLDRHAPGRGLGRQGEHDFDSVQFEISLDDHGSKGGGSQQQHQQHQQRGISSAGSDAVSPAKRGGGTDTPSNRRRGPDIRPKTAGDNPYQRLSRENKMNQDKELMGRMMNLEQSLLEQRTMWLMAQRDMKDRLRKAGAAPAVGFGGKGGFAAPIGGTGDIATPFLHPTTLVETGAAAGKTTPAAGAEAVSAWYQQRAPMAMANSHGSGNGKAGNGNGNGHGNGNDGRIATPRAPTSAPSSANMANSPRQGHSSRWGHRHNSNNVRG